MKLLSVKQARSIWLVNITDLNPRGLNLLALLPPMVSRYNFQMYPSKPEEIFGPNIKELKFSGGSFQIEPNRFVAVELTIFNDGLVVDTRSSTKESDAFLNDILNYVSIDFGLTPYQEILRSKIYVSELWVQTNKSLNALNPKLEKFSKKLTSLMKGLVRQAISYETSGISFCTDPIGVSPPNIFRFERAIDRPFAENRYYSAAPLQTDIHFEMLEELEKILSS